MEPGEQLDKFVYHRWSELCSRCQRDPHVARQVAVEWVDTRVVVAAAAATTTTTTPRDKMDAEETFESKNAWCLRDLLRAAALLQLQIEVRLLCRCALRCRL